MTDKNKNQNQAISAAKKNNVNKTANGTKQDEVNPQREKSVMTDESKNHNLAISTAKKNNINKTANETKQDEDNHQREKSDLEEIFEKKPIRIPCDKLLFQHKGFIVQQEMLYFFDASEIKAGEQKDIVLVFEGLKYNGHIRKSEHETGQTKIFWDTSLAEKFEPYTNDGKQYDLEFLCVNNDRYDVEFFEKTSKKANTHAYFSGVIRTVMPLISAIQVLANIAVIIGVIFTFRQFYITIRPILYNQLLMKANTCVSTGQYEQAISIYEKLSDKNVPVALNNLGYLYQKGLGVKADSVIAQELYKKAIQNGSDIAVNNLILLDFEINTDEAKEDLIEIFRSAYEVKNEPRTACAIAFALSIRASEIRSEDIQNGMYDDLFANNAEIFIQKFNANITEYSIGNWVYSGKYYYSSASKEYRGKATQLVFVDEMPLKDAKEQVDSNVFENWPADKVFIYNYYVCGEKCTDILDRGIEKVSSYDGSI